MKRSWMIALACSGLLTACGASPAIEPAAPPEVATPAANEPPPAKSAEEAKPPEPPKPEEKAQPEPPPREPEAKAPSDVPGANVTVGSMTADGLTVENLVCKIDSAGLLTTIVIIGTLSKKAKAFAACAPGHDKPRVTWTIDGKKIKDVKVKASTPAIEKCVAKTMQSVQAALPGVCGATLVL